MSESVEDPSGRRATVRVQRKGFPVRTEGLRLNLDDGLLNGCLSAVLEWLVLQPFRWLNHLTRHRGRWLVVVEAPHLLNPTAVDRQMETVPDRAAALDRQAQLVSGIADGSIPL